MSQGRDPHKKIGSGGSSLSAMLFYFIYPVAATAGEMYHSWLQIPKDKPISEARPQYYNFCHGKWSWLFLGLVEVPVVKAKWKPIKFIKSLVGYHGFFLGMFACVIFAMFSCNNISTSAT